MKHLFLPLVLLGLLTGCSKKSDPDPAPVTTAPDDVISLQVTGTNLNGLNARLQVAGASGDDGKPTYVEPGYATDEYYTTSVTKTMAVATVPHYRAGARRYDFTATISFTTVLPSAPTPGRLTVQWLVNGKPSTATSRPATATISGGSTPTSAIAYLSTNAL